MSAGHSIIRILFFLKRPRGFRHRSKAGLTYKNVSSHTTLLAHSVELFLKITTRSKRSAIFISKGCNPKYNR